MSFYLVAIRLANENSNNQIGRAQKEEPGHAKMYIMPYRNNKGIYQPAFPHSLTNNVLVFAAWVIEI